MHVKDLCRKLQRSEGWWVALLGYAGMAVIVVGLILILAGMSMVWRAEKGRQTRGPAEFVDALTHLVEALSKHPIGIRLVVFGVLLVFLGGVISTAGALI